jgi:hypothetical protein
MSQPPPAPPAPRARDRVHGLVILFAAFVASIGISLWAKRVSSPEPIESPAPATTVGISGFPSAVDPIKTLPLARGLTRRTVLRGFIAEGVTRDGTLDMGREGVGVRYVFQSPPGQGPQPPRKPGEVPRHRLCGRQAVQIGRNGIVAEPDQARVSCPAKLVELPEPKCTLFDVWRHAIKAKRANKKRRARIEYYPAKAGPAFRFELPGRMRFSLDSSCQRELTPHEAAGAVP